MEIKLNYVEAGTGEPLILLHGNGGDHTCFVHQIDYFSKHYRVIAIDTRGHGKSPRGSKPFTLKQFAEDLYDFMKEKKIAKADILGFSDGGNIALLFAIRYPEKVNKLIVNGANAFPSGMNGGFTASVIAGWALSKVALAVNKNIKLLHQSELLQLMATQPHITEKQLEAISAPTLVIAGTKDLIKENHTRYLHEHIKNSRLVFIGGDHSISMYRYGEFNEAVERFLQD